MKTSPCRFYRQHFLGCEFILSLLAVAALIVWVEVDWFGGEKAISDFLEDRRGTLYGTFASIAGSLLGFVVATVSIMIAFASSPRLEKLRENKHYETLWRVFTGAIRALAFTTFFLLIGLIFDHEKKAPPWIFWVSLYPSVFGLVWSLFRVWRCVWVLEKVIGIIKASP